MAMRRSPLARRPISATDDSERAGMFGLFEHTIFSPRRISLRRLAVFRSVMGLNSMSSTRGDAMMSLPSSRSRAEELSFFSATSLKMSTAGAARAVLRKSDRLARSCSIGLSRGAPSHEPDEPDEEDVVGRKEVDGSDSKRSTGGLLFLLLLLLPLPLLLLLLLLLLLPEPAAASRFFFLPPATRHGPPPPLPAELSDLKRPSERNLLNWSKCEV